MDESKCKRMRFICHGRVQGVGFRYRACRAARALDLSGFVGNRYDGTVELELQGEVYLFARFWEMLLQNSYIDIYDKEVKELPLKEHELGFSVMDYWN